MGKIYRLKESAGNLSEDFSERYETFDVKPIKDLNEDCFEVLSLYPFYSSIEVPVTISQLVSDFCKSHKSKISKQKILSLIGGAQRQFFGEEPLETDSDPIVKDFETERVELRRLLNLVKKYKFSSHELGLHSIRFVGPNNKAIENFQNSWVFHRIFEGIFKELGEGIDSPEAFDAAAEKKIATTNSVIFSKRQHYIKGIAARAFDLYLQSIIPDESQRYRDTCTGVFLNCAQIPVLKEYEPLLNPVFKMNFSETDSDHIRKLRERVENSLIKY